MPEIIAASMIVGVVRIVAFTIAGLLAYFGYKLFFSVPHKSDSGGTIETPGLTITLSRIAPGTFFAICAAGIVVASFVYPMKIQLDNGVYGAGAAVGSLGEITSNKEQLPDTPASQALSPLIQPATEAQRAHVLKALQHLNCLRTKSQLEDSEVNAIDQARVALVGRIWIEDWGDFQIFETWAMEGRGDPPVTRLHSLFNQEHPQCTR